MQVVVDDNVLVCGEPGVTHKTDSLNSYFDLRVRSVLQLRPLRPHQSRIYLNGFHIISYM
jgi:hypothetical protein